MYEWSLRIGVATAARPAGPFIAQPQPLAGSYSIDPAVFCDARQTSTVYLVVLAAAELAPALGAPAHCVRRPSLGPVQSSGRSATARHLSGGESNAPVSPRLPPRKTAPSTSSSAHLGGQLQR